nr:hypothetical protein [Prochlorococcus marinus]
MIAIFLRNILKNFSCALGALGRRFESCRPDSSNPSHRKSSQSFFFIT